MIRSRIAMGFFWVILALALHICPGVVAPAHGQGSRKDDIVFNSRGVPLAGATVRVCLMPATGQPCTPLALIYSDAALTQALANPTTSDGLGNYSDRKSTRLNSSHDQISYAVFCLKKKN